MKKKAKKTKRVKKIKTKKIPLPQGNEFKIPRYIMPPKKPLVPVLISDPNIGLLILFSLTILSLAVAYKVWMNWDS
jgi:hypothetical protein